MAMQITLILTLLVTVVLVSSGRRPTPNERTKYLYRSLWNLKAKIKTCTGKFMCDFQTTSRSCDMNCINHDKLCDGHDDCSNKADEVGCPTEPTVQTTSPPCPECEEKCSARHYTCDNGKCVPIDDVCNSQDDCGDMSDEKANCTIPTTSPPCEVCEEKCSARHYTCDNGKCVPIGDVCNGQDNCEDGSDEHANCGCIISANTSDICVSVPLPEANIYAQYSPRNYDIKECIAVCQALLSCQGLVTNPPVCIIVTTQEPLEETTCTDDGFRFSPCIQSKER